jgi:hypothetical protein
MKSIKQLIIKLLIITGFILFWAILIVSIHYLQSKQHHEIFNN